MELSEAKEYLDSALKAWKAAVTAQTISEGDRSITRDVEQAQRAVAYWQRQVKNLEADQGSRYEYRIATWNQPR